MKILWIVNILFPEAQQLLSGEGELKTTGGWMLGAAHCLLQIPNVELYIATVSKEVNSLACLKGKNITYYILPLCGGNLKINNKYIPFWQHIQREIQPDVVHVHGTEYSHAYSYMKAIGCKKVVISIQGLTSVYTDYFHYGMQITDIYRNFTFKDLVKGSILSEKRLFRKCGLYEEEMIKMAHHIIGRTSWDKTRVWAINPKATYHFCNEILRDEFYDGSCWNYASCRKHSIFLSQATYPIKGLHQVLKAMPFILQLYPDTIIRIGGRNIIKTSNISEFIRFSGYGLYIKRLIKRLGLQNHVFFVGNLNAGEMKQEYLKTNVFVSPASIENSPNSLGEAQILGTPCVASYVGGVMDMMKGNENNLYRFEEYHMLAAKICAIFSAKDKQVDMRNVALERHNRDINTQTLYGIYNDIVKN